MRGTSLSDPQEFVRLQAQPPLRPLHADPDRMMGVAGEIRPIHRLEREALKAEGLEAFWS